MEKINEMYLSVTETTDSIYRTEDKIQKAYNNYIKLGDEDYIRELVELTNIKWKHKVMEYLRNRGCLDDDTLDDSLCNAWLGVWKAAKGRVITSDPDSREFCLYSCGIYMNSAKSVVRKYYRKKNTPNINTTSIEWLCEVGANVVEDQEEQGDNSKHMSNSSMNYSCMQTTYENDNAASHKHYVYKKLLKEYIDTLTSVDVSPQKVLAHIYARIIPHILDEIPDTKASSVKNALARMEGKTIQELATEAERLLKGNMFPEFSFDQTFMERMEQNICTSNYSGCIGDLIYTSVYDEDKIEHWCDDLHKIIIRETYKRIQEEASFMCVADKYLKHRDKCCTLIGKKYIKPHNNSKLKQTKEKDKSKGLRK